MVLKQTRQDFQILSLPYLSIYACIFLGKKMKKKRTVFTEYT